MNETTICPNDEFYIIILNSVLSLINIIFTFLMAVKTNSFSCSLKDCYCKDELVMKEPTPKLDVDKVVDVSPNNIKPIS